MHGTNAPDGGATVENKIIELIYPNWREPDMISRKKDDFQEA